MPSHQALQDTQRLFATEFSAAPTGSVFIAHPVRLCYPFSDVHSATAALSTARVGGRGESMLCHGCFLNLLQLAII